MEYLIDGLARPVDGCAARFQLSGEFFCVVPYRVEAGDPSGRMPGLWVAVGVGKDPVMAQRLTWQTEMNGDEFRNAQWIHFPDSVAAGIFGQPFIDEIFGRTGECENCDSPPDEESEKTE